MITLYGINSCDTVRKARRWLQNHSIEFHYHDLRDDGLSRQQVAAWCDELGWETLLNRRSTSWKALPEDLRQAMDAQRAVDAIVEHPTLIKRPLLDTGSERHTGFKPEQYASLFDKHNL